MTQQHSASNTTQKRKTRTYRIVKWLAMESGYMAGPNDIAGLERWCDEYDRLNVPPEWPVRFPSSMEREKDAE